MTQTLRCLCAALLIAGCATAFAAGQASTGYKVSSDALNSGVADMGSTNYRLGGSLGDPVFNGPVTSASYALAGGFASDVDIPVVLIAPTSLAFGSQSVGSTSTIQSVTVTNVGVAPLTLAGFAVTGDFGQGNSCGSAIASGANCLFSVAFTPTAAGLRSGSLGFTSNAAGTPYSVSLSGTGVLAAQTINFPAIGNRTLGSSAFAPTVSATSGLPVALASLTTAICTTSGANVTLLALGTCTLQANQTGNGSFAAAPTVSQSFSVVAATTGSAGGDVPLPPWAYALLALGLMVAVWRNSRTQTIHSGQQQVY